MSQCKSICKHVAVKRIWHTSMYALGCKWCTLCEVFVKWEGRFCPCCGLQLRTKPKASHGWKPEKRPWEIVA